ncbi:MAG: glycosyltransferase [Clostridia bacterium]|nr:glycosyltransferase [Clostridia bacterium]
MKILIVLPQLRTGGGQKLALDEAIGLAKLGADVTILSLYPRENTVFTKLAEDSGIPLIFLEKQAKKSLKLFGEVKRVVKKLAPDVIHTHLMALPYVLPAARASRARCFHTVHNVAEREATGMMRTFEKWAYRHCRFTPIAISPYCRKTISDLYHIPEDAISTVVNGIDTVRFKVTMPYADRPASPFTIVSTGRMEEQKRQSLMLEVFSRFHKRHPDSRLRLLGDGPMRPQLEEQIAVLGLLDAVELPGIVSDVETHLNEAHLFMLTSEYEGLPLSVLEAMSCGLPVVATRAGGTVDVVTAETGLLTDIGDLDALAKALCKLADDPVLCASMSAAAVKEAQKYDISACVKGYADLFGVTSD